MSSFQGLPEDGATYNIALTDSQGRTADSSEGLVLSPVPPSSGNTLYDNELRWFNLQTSCIVSRCSTTHINSASSQTEPTTGTPFTQVKTNDGTITYSFNSPGNLTETTGTSSMQITDTGNGTFTFTYSDKDS
ncbi:hypothetical protein BDQ17DRAFT_152554 [Cyathus striatus]|nr:hypothetical protein BDQ17DRAFT_152554 [Cyathus striatus]